MNAARRARQKANRERDYELEQVAVPEAEAQYIPHFTVTAGLATAVGSVKPEKEDQL